MLIYIVGALCLLSTGISVPVTASSSMKNRALVLSMNGEVAGRYFLLSVPQAKLGNTHGAHFLFLWELLTPQDPLGSLPNWQRRALQWHLLSKNEYAEKRKS